MGSLVQDSFSGLKTALAEVRTVQSHVEAGKREITHMLVNLGRANNTEGVTAWFCHLRALDKSSGSHTEAPPHLAVGQIHRASRQMELQNTSYRVPCFHFLRI